VHGARQYWSLLFRNLNYNETTGAEAKPGGDVMVVHCKKAKLFITGEVFPLDIGLLMGAVVWNFQGICSTTRYGDLQVNKKNPSVVID